MVRELVTYCNGRPQALIVSGDRMGRPDMVEAGTRSLNWLLGAPSPTAVRGDRLQRILRTRRARDLDQQPVEARGIVSACSTRTRGWRQAMVDAARWAFNWFLEKITCSIGLPLRQAVVTGCTPTVPINQGAEATLSFLLALHEVRTMAALDAGRMAQAVLDVPGIRRHCRPSMKPPHGYETLFLRHAGNPF
jgi:hypothetical protein